MFRNVFILLALASLVLASSDVADAQSRTDRRFRISGIAVSAADGAPLSQARVSITEIKSPSNVQSVITREDGRFEFIRLRGGKYSLQGARRGFITGAYNQHEQFSTAIVAGAEVDSEHLVLRLVPDAALIGTVSDEAGEPVRTAQVRLYRETHGAGMTRIIPSRGDETDDRGSFEFAPLDPGNYFVSVTATPWYAIHRPRSGGQDGDSLSADDRALDVAYATTYYGDVTDADESTPIPIRGGDRIKIVIHLNPVPALHLIFHAADPEHGAASLVLQKRVFDSVEQLSSQAVQQLSPGVFELTGIPAGRYGVRVLAGGRAYGEATDMDLSRDGQELDTSAGQAMSKVKITVPDRIHLPLQLAIAMQDSQRRVVAYKSVQDSGEVTFDNVEPGHYTILAGASNKAYSVVSIASKQGTTSGHTLNVPAGASLDVTVTLAGGELEVEGYVSHGGKPVAGAMVVLIPKDPEANRELFRRDQSDLDGSFTLHSVIPGTYSITAIQDGWDLEWSKPGVIGAYAKRGQTLTVPPNAGGTVHVALPVEVKAR